jgi:6-phospho-beta-glucosidase
MAKSGIRVAVVGGGSSYTPELIDGFLQHRDIPVERITLLDVPAGKEKLSIVHALAQRMMKRAGLDIQVEATLDRAAAFQGVDFVCTQYRVGGLRARARDEAIPLRYDCLGQETIGAGGFAKGLRTVPVALDIARDIQRLSPDAWLLNFTNPAGMVTEALLNYGGVKTIGLCNAPIGLQRGIAHALGVDMDRIGMDFFGLNHLSFARHVYLDGEDITDRVLGLSEEADEGARPANIPAAQWGESLMRAVRMFPNGYLRYYWMTDEMIKHQKEAVEAGRGTRATQVMAIEAELFKRYQDPELAEKPPELMKRGGAYYSEVAVSLIHALALNKPREMVVNVQNGCTLPDLPPEASVEVSCLVDGRGARPLYQGPMPLSVRGLVQQVKAYEQLTIQAAMTGNQDTALMALANNPVVPSVGVAETLLQDILRENRAELPNFKG